MFGFFKKKKDKAEWAATVFSQPPKNPEKLPEAQLIDATGMMISQHKRIILESAGIVKTTRNKNTDGETGTLQIPLSGAFEAGTVC